MVEEKIKRSSIRFGRTFIYGLISLGISIFVPQANVYVPIVLVPTLTAFLTALDKYVRDRMNE